MTATKVLIIYSNAQNIRRRVIKADRDEDLECHKDIHINERWLEIPINIYESFGSEPDDIEFGNTLDVYIARILGNPQSDRCAVICHKQGICLHIIHADPEIDEHPEGKIILHEKLSLGEKP